MHYYQHHIGDYRRDTIHLTLLEHGIYRQLLDCYYLSETPLPAETQQVMRRVSARTDEERATVESVLHEFFERTPEGWVHTRCDREIVAYRERAQRSRDNGKRGGRPVSGSKAGAQAGITQQVISGLSKGTRKKANALTQEHNNSTSKNHGGVGASPPPPMPPAPPEKTEPRRLSEDWILPSEWKQWAAAPPRSLSAYEIEDEARRFKRYWLGRGGQKAMKKDWRATWRNWILKKCAPAPRSRYPEKFNPLAYINSTLPQPAMEAEYEVIQQ